MSDHPTQESSKAREERDLHDRHAEGSFAKAGMVGGGMFLPALIVLVIAIVVILYFVLR